MRPPSDRQAPEGAGAPVELGPQRAVGERSAGPRPPPRLGCRRPARGLNLGARTGERYRGSSDYPEGRTMGQATEMQVTPAEARFLRRFFRRQALPWILILGVVAIGAARWAVPPADPGIDRPLPHSSAAIAALRAENAALPTELHAIGPRLASPL